MIFDPLEIDGAFRIRLEKREDERGFFARMYCSEEFASVGIDNVWCQMNTASNRTKGTLRGMHFQRSPMADAKLVRCLRGEIYDVIVDIRQDSKTFGTSAAVRLSDDNRDMLYVPTGCAHGYQTLTVDVELLYLHSANYSPACEGGLAWNDPAVDIKWPLPPSELSDRDRNHPNLADLEPVHI